MGRSRPFLITTSAIHAPVCVAQRATSELEILGRRSAELMPYLGRKDPSVHGEHTRIRWGPTIPKGQRAIFVAAAQCGGRKRSIKDKFEEGGTGSPRLASGHMQQSTEELYRSISSGEGLTQRLSPTPGICSAWPSRTPKATTRRRERRAARRAGATVSHGHPILWDLVIDPEPTIRKQVFQRAIDAQHDGLQLLRRAAESADEEMACTAVRHLTAAVDRPSLPSCDDCQS